MIDYRLSKTTALLAGSLLTLGAGMPITASASGNPFEMKDLSSGYQVAHEDQKRDADSHDKDTHESGEKHIEKEEHSGDHDGDDDHNSKSPEGKCGAKHMDENEGKCGGMK